MTYNKKRVISSIRKKPTTFSHLTSTGQDVNRMLGLVNMADTAFGALNIDAPTRKQVKKGLVLGVLAIGLAMLIKKVNE